ncbi:hypothetical protein HC891_27405, partial [Candidatus Gracilibacteria bacterium]|nr:hypothetical protein [Candidatus Gracilibacteria bacterium]
RLLSDLVGGARAPAWSPDGQRLAFYDHGRSWARSGAPRGRRRRPQRPLCALQPRRSRHQSPALEVRLSGVFGQSLPAHRSGSARGGCWPAADHQQHPRFHPAGLVAGRALAGYNRESRPRRRDAPQELCLFNRRRSCAAGRAAAALRLRRDA